MTQRTSQLPPGRSSIRCVLLLVLTAAAGAGCRNRGEQTIKDTEGRSFLSQCSTDRICAVTQKSGPEAEATARPIIKLRATGRVVGVCGPLAAGTEPAPSDCRPVICARDGDCPAADGLSTGVCIGRLCTEPSHAINSDDSVMLCLAGTGVGTRTGVQVERLALGLNCGTPCRVPRPCLQL